MDPSPLTMIKTEKFVTWQKNPNPTAHSCKQDRELFTRTICHLSGSKHSKSKKLLLLLLLKQGWIKAEIIGAPKLQAIVTLHCD